MQSVVFAIELTLNIVLILTLSSLNAVQATAALTGKCARQVCLFELEGLEVNQGRSIFTAWVDNCCPLKYIVDSSENCDVILVLPRLQSLILFDFL